MLVTGEIKKQALGIYEHKLIRKEGVILKGLVWFRPVILHPFSAIPDFFLREIGHQCNPGMQGGFMNVMFMPGSWAGGYKEYASPDKQANLPRLSWGCREQGPCILFPPCGRSHKAQPLFFGERPASQVPVRLERAVPCVKCCYLPFPPL